MIRDLVKEEAVARAVRWAEMLPADATAEDKDRAEAILAMRGHLETAIALAQAVERLSDDNFHLNAEVYELGQELEQERASSP